MNQSGPPYTPAEKRYLMRALRLRRALTNKALARKLNRPYQSIRTVMSRLYQSELS
jgi:hypothetical protein